MSETGTGEPLDGHFGDEEWVDLARGQGGEELAARLGRHLDAGCGRCAQKARFWRAVVGLAGREASYRPPDAAVAQVRAQLALHRPKRLLERAARSASLLFDSFRQPLPAGVRSVGPSPQQLLYKAGRYLIVLRVEAGAADSERLSVVGQILDDGLPKKALQDLPVLVFKGREAVDRTLTNPLGEFQLQTDPAHNLRLSVEVPEVGPFIVTLPRDDQRRGPRGTGRGKGGR